MSRTNTRHLVVASLSVAALVALAGCSSGGSADSGDSGDSAGSAEGGTISLWTHAGGNDIELAELNAIVEAYNASQDAYVVEVEDFPQDTYNSSVVAAAASDNLPCILDVDAPAMPNWAWAGYIQPLGLDYDFSDHLSGTLGVIDDEVYSFGFFDVALSMFTRQSTLDAAGVRTPTVDDPWTGEEFDEALRAIDGLGQFDYAFDMPSWDGEGATYLNTPFLWSFGGDLINRDDYLSADGVLNGAAAIEFAEWRYGLIADGLIPRTSGEDSAVDFTNGVSGILWTGNWSWNDIKGAFEDSIAIPPPDFGNGPTIGAGSWQWALSSGCDLEEGARDYLEFSLQEEYLVSYAEAVGLIPATNAAAAAIPAYAEGGDSRIFFEFADKFAMVRPVTPAYQFISSVFSKAVLDIQDGADPQSVLDQAVIEIDTDIKENGNYDF